jgi:hypothetical protein
VTHDGSAQHARFYDAISAYVTTCPDTMNRLDQSVSGCTGSISLSSSFFGELTRVLT